MATSYYIKINPRAQSFRPSTVTPLAARRISQRSSSSLSIANARCKAPSPPCPGMVPLGMLTVCSVVPLRKIKSTSRSATAYADKRLSLSTLKLIWDSVFVGKNQRTVRTKNRLNVVGRVKAFVAGCTITNFKIHDITVGTINEVMRLT
jgi:hypothetical protein